MMQLETTTILVLGFKFQTWDSRQLRWSQDIGFRFAALYDTKSDLSFDSKLKLGPFKHCFDQGLWRRYVEFDTKLKISFSKVKCHKPNPKAVRLYVAQYVVWYTVSAEPVYYACGLYVAQCVVRSAILLLLH